MKFKSTDRYIVGINGNDSGSRNYSDTTVVGGLTFQPIKTLHLYASTGNGFETPTFNELAYRSDGTAGLALNLLPANSKEYEVGAKWRPEGGAQIDAAIFRADTSHDLVVARNSGGRSSYQNISRSRRAGFEAGALVPLAMQWQLQASYTYLDAIFPDSYKVCAATPCTTPNVTVAADSRIPGVARHQGQIRLQWTPGPWVAALEFAGSTSVIANDTSTARAPGYGVWNAELGFNYSLGDSRLHAFVRGENLLDHTYVGSVIVNEGNNRFFEAAAGRSATVGLQWRWN